MNGRYLVMVASIGRGLMRKITFPLLLIGLLVATLTAHWDESGNDINNTLDDKTVEQQGDALVYGAEEIHGTVSRVIDGDTAVIRLDNEYIVRGKKLNKGAEITTRFLLIDTPESVGERAGMPYGQEASDYAKELLAYKQVTLEFDSGDIQDHYDRFLTYIYVDGERVQDLLIQNGFAVIQFIKEPNTRYLMELERLEASAKEKELGVWSIPYYVQEGNWFNEDLTEAYSSEKHPKSEFQDLEYLSEKASRGLKILRELVGNGE